MVLKLSEIYPKYSMADAGGDKNTAHTYIDIYEAEMQKISDISLLEIGVYQGHSIAMWMEYFENSEIIGVDITNNRMAYDIPFIVADATRPVPQLADKKFDYIIDDGSHTLADQLTSFEVWWPSIKPGGKYFIEDIIGTSELIAIQNMMQSQGVEFQTYDHRHLKGRSDDIMVVAHKVN
jgi:ubiquinone/menaquinone biosynthesis C-methylase UbiE